MVTSIAALTVMVLEEGDAIQNTDSAAQTALETPDEVEDSPVERIPPEAAEQEATLVEDVPQTQPPETDHSEEEPLDDAPADAITNSTAPEEESIHQPAGDESIHQPPETVEADKTEAIPEETTIKEKDQQIQKHKDVIVELKTAVKREVEARKELEDMLMRMEQHLRTEEEARKESEQQLDISLKNASRLKAELENLYHHRQENEAELERQRVDVQSERQALEEMRRQMEIEIATAQEKAQKAIDNLKTAEDRVRAQERTEMAKMESEYQKRVSLLGLELERVRQELVIRTKLLSEEMERWRQQAEFTAAAVVEAKAEVTERKRDLDATRDKMDRLVDRLHMGREHGLVLQASLAAANAYTTQAQRSLIHSMESSFQNNVRETLPWNGPSTIDEMGDPMAALNRGMDIKPTKAPSKPRILDNGKQTGRQKPTRQNRGRG